MQLTSTLAVVVAVMAFGCFNIHAAPTTIQVYDQTGKPLQDAVVLAPSEQQPTNAEANRVKAPAIMDQINKAFVPKVLSIEEGRSVSFPNSDNIRHHVYSFSAPKTFELKLYAKQPEHPIAFEEPGIVVLGCNIHDHMIGFIVVSDTGNWGQTDHQGQTTLDLNGDIQSLRVWHPDLQSGFNAMENTTVNQIGSQATVTIQVHVKPPPDTSEKRGFGSDRFKAHGR